MGVPSRRRRSSAGSGTGHGAPDPPTCDTPPWSSSNASGSNTHANSSARNGLQNSADSARSSEKNSNTRGMRKYGVVSRAPSAVASSLVNTPSNVWGGPATTRVSVRSPASGSAISPAATAGSCVSDLSISTRGWAGDVGGMQPSCPAGGSHGTAYAASRNAPNTRTSMAASSRVDRWAVYRSAGVAWAVVHGRSGTVNVCRNGSCMTLVSKNTERRSATSGAGSHCDTNHMPSRSHADSSSGDVNVDPVWLAVLSNTCVGGPAAAFPHASSTSCTNSSMGESRRNLNAEAANVNTERASRWVTHASAAVQYRISCCRRRTTAGNAATDPSKPCATSKPLKEAMEGTHAGTPSGCTAVVSGDTPPGPTARTRITVSKAVAMAAVVTTWVPCSTALNGSDLTDDV